MADTQINVGMNVDGVITGTEKAKRKISELGGAAREAGKGTGAIGDGMAGSAQKVEAATKNMVGSIQRQIAALEAGDKTSRKYQESLAKMRGIDVAALRPYLDQLDQVKAKQLQAATSSESLASNMGLVRTAALAAGAAVGVTIAFAKSIIDSADGLNDLSQRIGVSVRDLGKYQLAAEQSGASLEAIAKGSKGLADNLLKHGDALRKFGIDATSIDGALVQLADVFAGMPDGIEKTALATKLFGKAGMDLIPMLNLGSEGLQKAAESSAGFAEQMAIMAPLADALNDNMAEIGMSTKTAGAAMVNEFLPSLNQITLALTGSNDSAKSLAATMGGVVNVAIQTAALLISDVVFVLKGMGREIGAIGAQVVALAKLDFKGFTAIGDAVKDDAQRARSELDKFQADLVRSGIATNVQAAYNKRQGTGEKLSTGSALLNALGGDSSVAKALREQNKELEIQAGLLAELSGYTKSYEDDARRLVDMRKKGLLTDEAYTRAITALVEKQPALSAATKAEADALKERNKGYQAAIDAQDKQAKSVEDLLKKQLEHNAGIGLSKEALAELEAATMLANAAEIERQSNLADGVMRSPEIIDGLKREAQAMRDLATAKVIGAQKQAGADAADDMRKEQKKAAEASEKYWEDALMRAFESGKGFFESLWDTIKNTLKTQVLKVMVQGTMGVLGIGAAGAASASSGGGTDILGLANMASSVSNAYNGISSLMTIGSQTLAGTMSAANALGTIAANATGTGITGLLATNGAYGTAAAGSASAAAGSMTSTLTAIPGWGWAAMGVAALAAIAGGHGETRSGAQYGNDGDGTGVNLLSGPSGGEIGGDAARNLFTATETAINDTLKKVGSAATLAGFEGGLESSENGKGFTYAGGTLSTGASFGVTRNTPEWYMNNRGDKTPEQAMAEYVSEMRVSVLEALQAATDVPKAIADQLKGVDLSNISQASFDVLEASVQKVIADVDAFNSAVKLMPFKELEGLSFDAASGLIAAAGGLETLSANLGTYYTNFYSEEEQRLQTIKTINATVAGSGLDAATATRESFRQIVEAQDLTTESGQQTYAALLSVSGAFAGLTESSDAAAKAIAEESAAKNKAIAEQRQSLQDELNALTDTAAQAIERERSTIDASNLELFDLLQATKFFVDGKEAFVTLSDALFKAGDAAELLAARTARAFADPSGQYSAGGAQYNNPQWEDGDTSATFNYKYGVMQARMRKDLGSELSANALSVQNIAEAMQQLSVAQMMSQYDPVTGPLYIGIRDAIVKASGDTTYAVRDAVDAASLYLAKTDVRGQYTSAGPGLASIYAAQAAQSSVSVQGAAGRFGWQTGEDVIAYGQALTNLEGTLKTGKIDADQFANAVESLNAAMPEAVELLGDTEAQMERKAGAVGALGKAGLDSLNYYFTSLSGLSDGLAKAAEAAADPIATMTASIGRLNSFTAAFGVSANAAMSIGAGSETETERLAMLEAASGRIGTGAMIAQAAAIASSVLTTADAAQAAKRLAETTAFADTSDVGIRNASLLLDGVRQYDAQSFENAFIKISDSYASGNLTGDQFTELFADALTSFQGVDDETKALTASMESLRDAMTSFADKLLIDQGRTTLTAGQTLAEMQRQYAVAYTSATTGDTRSVSQFQSLATDLLDKDLYSSQSEYNAAFGRVYGDARNLETLAIETIAVNTNQQNEVVNELREMNTALNNRVESLEKNLTAALAVIARNTAKTSQGIEQQNTVGVTIA